MFFTRIKKALFRLQARDDVRRAEHAFWQTFLPVFSAGALDVLGVFKSGGLHAGTAALLALVIASLAAGLSGLKSYATAYVRQRLQQYVQKYIAGTL